MESPWIPRVATGQRVHTLEPHESAWTRTHIGQSLQGSRCFSPLQCQIGAIHANDERAGVLASGLPLFHGAQLAVDITLRCALTASGTPRPGARADKIEAFRAPLKQQVSSCGCGSMETRGRWSPEAVEFVENLAAAKDTPPTLQRSSFWRGGRGCSPSLAAGLLRTLVAQSSVPHALAGNDGSVPNFADVLGRCERPSCASCRYAHA